MRKQKLRRGDKIWTPGFMARHYGIYLGACWGLKHAVIHNIKGQRVAVTSMADFSPSGRVFIEQSAPVGSEEVVVARALELVDREYDLLQFNCEHFASLAADGRARSPQLASAAGLSALAFMLWAASRNRTDYDAYVDRYRDRRGRFAKG